MSVMSLTRIGVDEVDTSRPFSDPPAPRRLPIPAGPQRLLRRAAVEETIRAGARHRLLLVTGPAGHGKTTSTAAALRNGPMLAWVTLDSSDRDPIRLQRRIVEALGSIGGFPVVDATAVAELDYALANCSRQLDAIAEEVVLVIDDAGDVLQSEPAAHRVERVLDWFPDGFHTVVLARRQPPLGIDRRRARGEVAEVGVSQLTFSDDEVAAYLDAVWDLTLDDATVRRVADIADGWPVVLQALATRMATEPGDLGTVGGGGSSSSSTGPAAMPRLLFRQLLDSLSMDDRRFMVDISVLSSFDADRCERLTGQIAGSERLVRLHAAGVIVAAEKNGTYRHRALVREILTEELGGLPGRASALHAIAAAIHRGEGIWTEAVDHSIGAGDVDLALSWAEEHLDELLHIDHGEWLNGTLDGLPATSLAKRPRLLVTWTNLALLKGDRERLEAILAILDDPAVESRDGAEVIRRIRAGLSRLRGDGVEPLVSRGRKNLEPVRAHPLGVALAAEGRHDAALASLRCALEDARRQQDPLRELAILADLAWERASAGYLVDADLLIRRSASVATQCGFPAPPLPALLAVAQIALDRASTAAARHDALQIQSAASRGCDLVLRADAGMLVSQAQWAHGDTDGAIRALLDVERELAAHTPGGGLMTRVMRARTSLRLALDDVEGAIACAPSIIVGQVDDLPPEDRIIAARVHLKLGDARSAKEAIETLRDHGIGPRLTVHALRIEASACSRLGEDLESARIRRGAERIARSAGLFAPTAPHGLSRPRHVVERDVDRPRIATATSSPAEPIEELTGRELDVLRRLASATNLDIAADLYVSVNTVKTHLKSIYRKLGVASRDAAVYEARRSGLV
jgi:LuxR family transcriptional regulator, maltose regulon positive regulatory protein